MKRGVDVGLGVGAACASSGLERLSPESWAAGAGPTDYKLGSVHPFNNTTWGTFRGLLPSHVPPGGQGTIPLSCIAPPFNGTYSFSWQMVHESIEWFGAIASKAIAVFSLPLPFPPPREDPDDLISYEVLDT